MSILNAIKHKPLMAFGTVVLAFTGGAVVTVVFVYGIWVGGAWLLRALG